jgi:ribokinase
MSRPRIVVVGSSNTDIVVRASRIPSPGETVLGHSHFVAAGGKGANQAVAAARLGAEVTLVARVGGDQFGDGALEGLRREGIRLDRVVRDPEAPSGIALIVVDERGENAIAVAPGANAQLDESDVDRAADAIADAAVLLLQLETPLPVVRHAARLGRKHGVPVVLNPAPAQPLGRDLLRDVTVLTPNRREAELLSGAIIPDERAAVDAARLLRDLGPETVVITLGAEGAVVASGDTVERIPAVKVTPVDTTAAGDAFNGALAYALATGRDVAAAAELAVRAGALAATVPGAQPSLPTREALERFSRQVGVL